MSVNRQAVFYRTAVGINHVSWNRVIPQDVSLPIRMSPNRPRMGDTVKCASDGGRCQKRCTSSRADRSNTTKYFISRDTAVNINRVLSESSIDKEHLACSLTF